MNRSEDIIAFAKAFAKAQGAVKNAIMDSENPGFKRDNKNSKYADLASCWDACREALTSNGISVVQSPETRVAGEITMVTLLLHESGQWIENELTGKIGAATVQAIGSTITYLRRYALCSMVGVAPEEDDGNAGSGKEHDGSEGSTGATPPRPKRQEAPETPSEVADFAAVKLSINNAISPAEAKAALNHRYVGHLREAGKLAGNIIRHARLAELEQLVQAKSSPKYFIVLDAEGKDVGSLVAGKAAAMIAGMIRKTPALTIAIYEHNQDTLADIAKAGVSIEDIVEAYNAANASVLSGAKQEAEAVDHDTSEVIPAAPVETAEQTEVRKAAELTALGQAICARMFKAKSVDALSTILDELEVQSLQKTAPEAFEKIVAYYDKRVGILDATPLSA